MCKGFSNSNCIHVFFRLIKDFKKSELKKHKFPELSKRLKSKKRKKYYVENMKDLNLKLNPILLKLIQRDLTNIFFTKKPR